MIIEIEGITCAGKTTIIPYLKEYLESLKLNVICLKEPGTTALGQEIRQILKNNYGDIDNITQLFLFLANRADVYDKHIKDKIDSRTDVIIFDRYLTSTYVYQLMTHDNQFSIKYDRSLIIMDKLLELSESIFNKKIAIELTLILDVAPETAFKRAKERSRDVLDKKKDDEFIKYNTEKIEMYKLYRGSHYGQQIAMINANGSVEETKDKAIHKVKKFIKTIKHHEWRLEKDKT